MPQLTATANSIQTTDGGLRTDPEGIAPASASTRVTWRDARGAERAMTLGGYLYQYDYSFDDNTQVVSRSANDAAWGHPGFGYVVSHALTGNSPLGKINPPTSLRTRVLRGGHHAMHRVELLYDRDREGGGSGIKIPVVIEWIVATGRDHPVWAVTWRTGAATNPQNVSFDAYRMDVRGPYGSLNFDGAVDRNSGDAIGGVAWGDFALRFTSTDGQFTMQSPWTYNTANRVCFVQAWTANVNAEMGIVQTRPDDAEMGYPDRVVGRERGTTSAGAYIDRRDCSGFGDNRAYAAPCMNGWPYQLMNYDWAGPKPLAEATGTKLLAWGSPYGWLGASTFPVFDYSRNADGRGDRSYATFIVLGPRNRFNAASGAWDADGDVELTLRAVEAGATAMLTSFSTGAPATSAPRGPGATEVKSLVNGYDDTYAAHVVLAQESAARFTITPAAGRPVQSPLLILRGYSSRALPEVRIDGATIAVNDGTAASGAFVSVDEATDELWVTLNRSIAAATRIEISPAAR